MPVTFPTSKLIVLVELYIAGAWVDVSSYAQYVDRIAIRRGRRPGQRRGGTNTCTVTFRNTDKRFSPRNVNGDYYGYLKAGTPIRVSVNPGTGSVRRFTGEVPTWTPQLRGHPNDRQVTITAVGEFDRIERDEAKLLSTPRRYIPNTAPLHYWSMEDGAFADELGRPDSGITSLYPFTGTHPSGAVISVPQWGNGALAPWLPSVLSRSGAAGYTVVWAPVIMPSSTTTWTIDLMYAMGTDVGADAVDLVGATIDVNPSYLGGSAGWPQLQMLPSVGQIIVQISASSVTSATLPGVFDGKAHHLRWTCTQSGAAVVWAVYIDGVAVNTGSTGVFTLPIVGQVGLAVLANASSVAQGHLAIWGGVPPDLTDTADAAFGHRGERGTDRFTRLLTEEGYTSSIATTAPYDTQMMGPQGVERLADLLRDVEQVTVGLIDETVDNVIRLVLPSARWGTSTVLTADYGAGDVQKPLPIDDNVDFLHNDWTITREDGATSRYQVTSGALSVNDYPDGVGPRPTGDTLALYTDDQTLAHAAYRANRDSIDKPRFPSVKINLGQASNLITSWLACDIASRVQVSNPPVDAGPDTLDTTIEGIAENIDQASWDVDLLLEPGDISTSVGTYDSATTLYRYDCPASSLNAPLDTTETTVYVAVNCTSPDTLCRWAHGDGDYVVRVAGETMVVTAVSSAASTFVAAGTAVHADNASVTPGLPAGMVKGDLMIIYAAIRSSGVGVPTAPAGYVELHSNGNVIFYYKVHTGSESAPVVAFTGGSSGDTCSAQMAAWRRLQPNVINVASQLNASAQNIAIPAVTVPRANCVVIIYGWKQDDWTSVSGSLIEISEPSSTLGNDQGLWWAESIQTTALDLASSTATVTGGASAISRGGAIVLASDVQALTVTRSYNSVVKTHVAGEAFGLAAPTRWAL